jgi:four helix bundle protein
MKIERFEDLDCWKLSRSLVKEIYQHCKHGELAKDWATSAQIKRASLSIMNNIAEGFGRYHHRDKLRFFDIAKSSAIEVKSMLYVLEDTEYLDAASVNKLHKMCDHTISTTSGLIRYLQKQQPHQSP